MVIKRLLWLKNLKKQYIKICTNTFWASVRLISNFRPVLMWRNVGKVSPMRTFPTELASFATTPWPVSAG